MTLNDELIDIYDLAACHQIQTACMLKARFGAEEACACRDFIVTGKETSTSISKGGHTQGTVQDDAELERKEVAVKQEDTVLAEGATPGGPTSSACVMHPLVGEVFLLEDKIVVSVLHSWVP